METGSCWQQLAVGSLTSTLLVMFVTHTSVFRLQSVEVPAPARPASPVLSWFYHRLPLLFFIFSHFAYLTVSYPVFFCFFFRFLACHMQVAGRQDRVHRLPAWCRVLVRGAFAAVSVANTLQDLPAVGAYPG